MHDAASRSASLTGPWTVASEVKAEGKKNNNKKKKPPSPGTGVVVGSERGSAHARREEREEHILMQRCCSGFGRTQPRSGRQHRALPRSTGSGGSGAPLCPGSCTTGGAARGKRVSSLSFFQPPLEEGGRGFLGSFFPARPKFSSGTRGREKRPHPAGSHAGPGKERARGGLGRFSPCDGSAGATQALPELERSRGWSWEETGGLRRCHL